MSHRTKIVVTDGRGHNRGVMSDTERKQMVGATVSLGFKNGPIAQQD